jgi:hypothetical protein
MTTDRTAWQLARLADVTDPDSPTSPGAVWLDRVAGLADDIEPSETSDGYRADAITEAADSAVPIYTHERWQVFVDLAAYNEDVTELGAESSDLTACAGIALFMIAERLLTALLDETDRGEA